MIDLIHAIFVDCPKFIGNWVCKKLLPKIEQDSLASQWVGFITLVLILSLFLVIPLMV